MLRKPEEERSLCDKGKYTKNPTTEIMLIEQIFIYFLEDNNK